jgi:endonuclease/exonuclease/phosphatase family metal-dependent hydrolase
VLLKVMSFNIRTASAPDGDQAWPRRKALVIERIRIFNPDLLGLQECRADAQGEFVRSALADYEFIGVPRQGAGDSAIEMAPLLYRRAAFEEIGRGHFWLSATPSEPGSKAWGAVYPRTATWVKLRPLNGGSGPLCFLNTHFDYEGASREESAGLLHRWARAVVNECPLVITGDFNAPRRSRAHRMLTGDRMLFDVHDEAGVRGGTFHGFGSEEEPEAIDWILASQHFGVHGAAVDAFRAGSLYPSDHFPITAKLVLENDPPADQRWRQSHGSPVDEGAAHGAYPRPCLLRRTSRPGPSAAAIGLLC